MKAKVVILFSLVLFSCISTEFVIREGGNDYVPPSKNLNVCKLLKDSVVIYAVFVDANKTFHPWTDYEINSTVDSIKKASRWIEKEAGKLGKQLKIKVVNHKDRKRLAITEKQARVRYPLVMNYEGLSRRKTRRYMRYHDVWVDKISKKVGMGIKKPRSRTVATRNKFDSAERVTAGLRDIYKNDNIAYMIFVNGYYDSKLSATYHSYTAGPRTEYSIVTTKNPAVIAHEFLHLFGAVDLYPTMLHRGFNFEDIEKNYPDDIMRVTHKEISKLKISPITKYFIGWQDSLNLADTRILFHKSNVVVY